MGIFSACKNGVFKMFGSIIFAVMLVIFFSEPVRSDSSTISLTFGTYESEKAAVVQQQFAPILEYMQSQMKKRLGRAVVYKAVATGVYDAGALKESTFNKLNKDGQLHIIHSFDNITKPWIARKDLDTKVFDAIKEALLNLKDPAVLKELKEATGFLPATDEDYKFVREGMQLSRKFEGDKK